MRSVLVAALVVRMSAAGGAGVGAEGAEQRQEAGNSWEDVRKHFSALRNELSTLESQFQEAREKHRLDAERQQQQLENQRRGQP
ncbi:MAG TPA: hypothetical protein VF794_37995 [Archangium sp.]|jgi:hypothetical protein|uniref:hypothetical protein n=1 Tax=Archangium sp. TaxID=1872627 RepID=UPI002EDB76BA